MEAYCEGCLSQNNLNSMEISALGERNYSEMLEICFNLKIAMESSCYICDECIVKLNSAFEFRELVVKSQSVIKEHDLRNSLVIKKEEDEMKDILDSEMLIQELEIEFDLKKEASLSKKNRRRRIKSFDNICAQSLTEESDEFINKQSSLWQSKKIKRKLSNTLSERLKKNRVLQQTKSKRLQKIDTSTETLKCTKCNINFDSECQRNVHTNNVHGAKTNAPEYAVELNCSDCKMDFDSPDAKSRHLAETHGKNFEQANWETRNLIKCQLCGFYFRDYSTRAYHALNHHRLNLIPEEMSTTCCQCPEKFFKYYQQVVHTYNEHKINMEVPPHAIRLMCELCDIIFEENQAFITHMTITHAKKLNKHQYFKCFICGLYFKRSLLRNAAHLGEHGAKSQTKKYKTKFKCNQCNLIFKLKSEKRRHLEVIHNILPRKYPCEVCGMQLSHLTGLKRHIQLLHVKSIVAICNHCNKGFRNKFDLIAHFSVHELAAVKHQCHICLREFKLKHSLKNHLKIHGNDKLTCDLCQKKFTHKCQLKYHMQRKHKQMPLTNF